MGLLLSIVVIYKIPLRLSYDSSFYITAMQDARQLSSNVVWLRGCKRSAGTCMYLASPDKVAAKGALRRAQAPPTCLIGMSRGAPEPPPGKSSPRAVSPCAFPVLCVLPDINQVFLPSRPRIAFSGPRQILGSFLFSHRRHRRSFVDVLRLAFLTSSRRAGRYTSVLQHSLFGFLSLVPVRFLSRCAP